MLRDAGKKLNVLSFGDEAEEEEAALDAATVRFRSAHETLRGDARLEEAPAGVHDAHVADLQARLARERVRRERHVLPSGCALATGRPARGRESCEIASLAR